MHILIVGAGAVGLTYGLAFHKAGARVSYLVKPAHVEGLKDGVTMLRHNLLLPGLTEERFVDFNLFDDVTSTPVEEFDQIWLTVPSDALSDDWLGVLRDGLADDAAVIGLQPGPKDDARLRSFFGDQLVKGVIGFLAYQYPLPGQANPKGRSGIAYLLPPQAGGLGPTDHSAAYAAKDMLAKGGLDISLSDNLAEQYGRVSALSLTNMAGLELAGWSLRGFRTNKNKGRALAKAAAVEALALVDHQFDLPHNEKRDSRLASLGPLVSLVAPLVPSIRLEPYLAFHFGKVSAQTRSVLRDYVALAREANMPSSAIQELLSALEALDETA